MRRISWERWSQLLRDQVGSGLRIAEFCRRKQLKQKSFYLWLRKLAVEPTAWHGFVVSARPTAVGESDGYLGESVTRRISRCILRLGGRRWSSGFGDGADDLGRVFP